MNSEEDGRVAHVNFGHGPIVIGKFCDRRELDGVDWAVGSIAELQKGDEVGDLLKLLAGQGIEIGFEISLGD
jgi:hypothetical protein